METSTKKEQLIVDLITGIKNNPVIYKQNYRSSEWNANKEIAWESIAKSIDLSEEICKKKWKGLRDTYKKRKRDIPAKSGPIKKWKYFDLMQFMDDDNNDDDGDEDIKDPSILFNTNSRMSYMDEEFEEILCDIEDCKDSTKPEPITPSKIQDAKKYTNMMSELIDTVKTSIKSEKKQSTALLFASLAEKLESANLPNEQLNEVERKVFNIVYEAIN